MKRLQWYIIVSLFLIGFSVLTYYLQIIIFNRNEETFFYLLQDLAFLPVQILLVTVIISEWLNHREKQQMLEKMNMVIGAFFSEVGTNLLKTFTLYDSGTTEINTVIMKNKALEKKELANLNQYFNSYSYDLNQCKDFDELKLYLIQKRPFLLRLLENPNLLEHESFTELLWAVFHLTEELAHRDDVQNLSKADHAHLVGDMKRVYILLISEWICYIKHLKVAYPFIFSLVMRTSPFDKNATAVIRD